MNNKNSGTFTYRDYTIIWKRYWRENSKVYMYAWTIFNKNGELIDDSNHPGANTKGMKIYIDKLIVARRNQ